MTVKCKNENNKEKSEEKLNNESDLESGEVTEDEEILNEKQKFILDNSNRKKIEDVYGIQTLDENHLKHLGNLYKIGIKENREIREFKKVFFR